MKSGLFPPPPPPLPVSAKLGLIHMREIQNIKRTWYLKYLFEWHSAKLQGEINLFISIKYISS